MKKVGLLTVCLMFCASAFAQDMALLSTRIINDPVNMSMAGAASASSSNISMSAFGNAAAMGFYKGKLDAQASFGKWAPNGLMSSRASLGVAGRLGKVFSLSLAGVYGSNQEYDLIDDFGVNKGTFKPSDMMFGSGIGIAASSHFGIGLNFRYGIEKLYEDTSLRAIMVDASFMYHNEGLNVSAGVRSLGPKIIDQSDKPFNLPYAANLAAYYSLDIAEGNVLGIGVDGNYFLSGGITAAAGLQYSWNDIIFARAGYHYGTSAAPLPQFLGIGLGVKYYGVSANVSYVTLNKAIGNTVALSLGYSF
ncbi:MAG: PorV/PorQ family protein [Bacteroidales bacterium]|nr:PorV/PorQ family protein [Bacteroidales bacterium]